MSDTIQATAERVAYARMREGPFKLNDLYNAAKKALGLTGDQPELGDTIGGIFTSEPRIMQVVSGRWILAARAP